MKKTRRKLKKSVFLIIVIVSVLLLGIGGSVGFFLYTNHQEEIRIAKEKLLVKKIKSHYSDVVTINKDTKLYKLDNKKYNEIGSISKDEVVSLDKADISKDTKYFKLKDYDYYVSYNDVKSGGELLEKSTRYKRYIPFNENVVSKDNVKFYRDGKEVYTSKEKIDLPIILKDDNGYFVEYMNELLLVKSEDVSAVRENHNSDEVESTSIPVTVYHFFVKEGTVGCTETICHPESQIRSHFDYLKNNNFFTMNTTELLQFIEGKIRVPAKSILITIDDGATAEGFVPLLNEYKINATLFVITYRFGGNLDKFASPYLELASHTHNLHDTYGGDVVNCGASALLTCTPDDKILEDLKTSRSILNNTEAFCFPLYVYNDRIIANLKNAGFKIAFIGGGRNVTRGIDPYKTPRKPIMNYTTLDQYISMVN